MALLEDYAVNNVFENSQCFVQQSPLPNKVLAAKINGIHTDIVLTEFNNCVLIVLTQYKKLGSLIAANKQSANTLDGCQVVYDIRTLFGNENIEYTAAVRYLYEQLALSKPCEFFISLKDTSLATLKALRKIILQHKTW